MSEWQPIETAPSDVFVLIYMPWNGMVRQARRLTATGGRTGWHVAFANGQSSYLTNATPTHWMPLPSPPVTHKE